MTEAICGCGEKYLFCPHIRIAKCENCLKRMAEDAAMNVNHNED